MSKITIPILLPKMGESVSEATIIEWFKKPGDKIERDELFVLIGTDKVESELPCEYEGVLKEILVPEKGETEVGAPICMLEVDEKDVQHIKLEEAINHTNTSKSEESSENIKSNSYKGSKSFLSPIVRRIATEAGLELNELEKIKGSGENGRIQKKDILKYLNPEKKQAVATTGFSR